MAKNGTQHGGDWLLPRIDRDLCTGCGDCIDACPVDALGLVGGRAALVEPGACIYCDACEQVCPVDAIELPFLICFEDALDDAAQIEGER